MRRFLLRLYPERWRAKYGDEFEVLLEERSLSPFDVADVVLAAVDARMHRIGDPVSATQRGVSMSRRVGGNAAVLGSCLLIVSQLVRRVSDLHAEFLILAGMAALVVAMAGLSASPSRRHPIATWAAFSVAAAGMLSWPFLGIVGDFVGEPLGELWAAARLVGFLALTGGSALFGLLLHGTATASRLASALLAASGAFLFIGILGVLVGAYVEPISTLAVLYGLGYLLFPVGWIALGWNVARLERLVARAAA